MRTSRPISQSILFLIGFLLTLTACQAPLTVPIEEVCQIENNNQTLTTNGYFSLDVTLLCSNETGEKRCSVILNNYPDGDMDVFAELKTGKGRNQMLPMESGYTKADLQIKTDNGDVIGVGEHVTVTGEMMVTQSKCVLYVDKIEAVQTIP